MNGWICAHADTIRKNSGCVGADMQCAWEIQHCVMHRMDVPVPVVLRFSPVYKSKFQNRHHCCAKWLGEIYCFGLLFAITVSFLVWVYGEWIQRQKPGDLPGFFRRGRYIVGSRNVWDYTELRRDVKERRRQNDSKHPHAMCFYAPFT